MLTSFKFVSASTSFSLAYLSSDFDIPDFKRMPPFEIELNGVEVWEENNSHDSIYDSEDTFLIFAIDTDEIEDFTFMEDFAKLSMAKCKIIICANSFNLPKIQGFDAVIKTSEGVFFAANDLSWAIASSLEGLVGLDEADIISILKTSPNGTLNTFSADNTYQEWHEALEQSKFALQKINKRKKIGGVFTVITLQEALNFNKSTKDIVIRNQCVSNKSCIIGASIRSKSHRYSPQAIIDLIMYS